MGRGLLNMCAFVRAILYAVGRNRTIRPYIEASTSFVANDTECPSQVTGIYLPCVCTVQQSSVATFTFEYQSYCLGIKVCLKVLPAAVVLCTRDDQLFTT